MTRSKEELEKATADAERWLDELDPAVLDEPSSKMIWDLPIFEWAWEEDPDV